MESMPDVNEKVKGLGNLAAALAKAQARITTAKKDRENPFFKSSYATLASVWDACRHPLADNGLAVVQTTEIGADSVVILVTRLIHESGEEVVSHYPVVPTKNDPQGYGSALTYARRYCLSAMVGVAPEDDDGNEASQGGLEKDRPVQNRKPAPVADSQPMRVRVASEADMVSPSALAIELERLTGSEAGARALLKMLISRDSCRGLTAAQVRTAWEALMFHPTYGHRPAPTEEEIAADVEAVFGRGGM